MIDFHNHVLANVDDGPKSLDESIDMLKTAEKQGITDIINTVVTDPYTSEHQQPLTIEEIKEFLEKYNLLESPVEQSEQRYWPGDKK